MGLGLVDFPTSPPLDLTLCPQGLALGPHPHLVCPSRILLPLRVSLTLFFHLSASAWSLASSFPLGTWILGISVANSRDEVLSGSPNPGAWRTLLLPTRVPTDPTFTPISGFRGKHRIRLWSLKQEWVRVLNLALGATPINRHGPFLHLKAQDRLKPI